MQRTCELVSMIAYSYAKFKREMQKKKLFEKTLDKGRRIGYYSKALRIQPEGFYPAGWFSRLERRPVTPEVEGSSPFRVAKGHYPVPNMPR